MAEPSKADIAMTASNPISAANGTIRAMVGHFTRVENQIKDIAAMAASSSVPSTTSYDELSSLLSELKLRQSNVSTAYDTLMTIDPNAIEKSNNRLDEIAKKYSSSVRLVNDALAHLDGLIPVSVGRVSFKANIGLQPFKLSRDANPEEVRTWIRAFRAFYSTSNMQVLAVVDQQAYFLASLEPSLAIILRDSIEDATPVLSDGGCVELLEQRFREAHPVFARRCALFSFRKIKSTRFADAYHQLRKQSDECELSSFNIQRNLLAFIMIRSCDDDPGLYTRLLELDNPDMTELMKQAKLYENASHPVPSEHVAALRETTSPQEAQRPKSWIYVCHGCGSEQHKKEQCPFKFTTCYDCNRTGHIANVCGEYSRGRKPYRNNPTSSGRSPYKNPKRNRERRTGTPVERNRSTSSARISAINEFTTKHDTPRILITCSFRSKKLLAIPDTGATRTVLPLTAIPDKALIRPSREPMKIVLDPTAEVKPIQVRTARPVPINLLEMSENLIKELHTSGAIQPVTTPTTWCSPAHFMIKPGDIWIKFSSHDRSIDSVDTHLSNACTQRRTLVFPSSSKLTKAPQFRTTFDSFCSENDIRHTTSSPYHARSNGLAELAIKCMKYLLKKCDLKEEPFRHALLEWRNTPRNDGFSPTQGFYGRQLRTSLPMAASPRITDQTLFTNARQKLRADTHTVHPGISLPPLNIGDQVVVQSPIDKLWSTTGVLQQYSFYYINHEGLNVMIPVYSVHEAVNRAMHLFRGQSTLYLYVWDRFCSSLHDVKEEDENKAIIKNEL
ncbi:hypothetical protein TCAL_12942 [Tigriopus californicus]|uniref:CCHC-type domain-containing protein n=1 Tax=Tigriopus californicus TaxID=6832 RepID=A0A553NX21_TIGCA|nr:hypothetical protein TCAL_12942 [Tigriopus californicus]